MQDQNGNAAAFVSGEGRKERVRKALAEIYGAPLFLAMIICFTLIQICGMLSVAGADMLLSSLGMGRVFPAAGLIVLFGPNLVIAAGMWLIYGNAKTGAEERKYQVGFTMIQVVQFNQMIVMLIGSIVLVALGWRAVDGIFAGAQETGVRIGLVLGAIGVVYYQFMMLLSVTLMKDGAMEQASNPQVSMSAAVLSILFGTVVLLIQLRFSVSLLLLLAGAYGVLQGICMILYRVRMSRLSE